MKCDTCDGCGYLETSAEYEFVQTPERTCPDCGGCGFAPLPEAMSLAVDCLKSIAESGSRQADYAKRTLKHIADCEPKTGPDPWDD